MFTMVYSLDIDCRVVIMKMRLLGDALWIIALLGIAIGLTAYFGLAIGAQAGASIGSILVGVIISERRLIYSWGMNLIRAASLLIEQQNDPGRFVVPYISDIDIFPNRLDSDGISQSYIMLTISWSNHMYRDVEIESIKGEMCIVGSQPPDSFYSIKALKLNRFESGELTGIRVDATGNALKEVMRLRKQKYGRTHISVTLSARINGKLITYYPARTYNYVD